MIQDGFIRHLDARLVGMFGWKEMPPLFMDTVYHPNSPDSLSPEGSQVNSPVSDGEGRQVGPGGTKRKDSNRDAARKSRRKQTDRADKLHEELQHLERSNSTLQKEIANLKKTLDLYQVALVRHEPSCRLRDAAALSSSSSPPQASTSSQISADALPTCNTSGLSFDYGESPHLSPSTLDSSTSLSSDTLTSSSSATLPHPASSSTPPVSHLLRSGDPPLSVTGSPTNVIPLCASSQPQSGQSAVHDCWSVSTNGRFSPSDFLVEHKSSFSAFSNPLPSYLHVASENTVPLAQGPPINGPQFHPGHLRGNPVNSNTSISGLPTNLQDPVFQSLSMSPQVDPELSHSHDIASSSASFLSLLTIPSPLHVSTITSGTLGGLQHQPWTSLPGPSESPSGDPSFSELLEHNEWILQELGCTTCNIGEEDRVFKAQMDII